MKHISNCQNCGAAFGAVLDIEDSLLPVQSKHLQERQAMQFAHNFADRAAHPGLNILDLAFEDVTHHGEQALEHIYAHAGKDFSATARAGVRKWEAGNAMHSRGVSLFSG